MRLFTRSALVLVAAATLVACGDDDDTVNSNADAPASNDAAGMCIEGSTDCNDTPDSPDAPAGDDADAIDEGAKIEEARALLGVAQDELDPEVRIARAGDEQFMLTEDYRIGRMTVELDPDDAGVMRVTKVVIELTDGPLTLPE